jgi:hypothetical protein
MNIYDLQLFETAEFGSTSTERHSAASEATKTTWPRGTQPQREMFMPRRRSSNAYDVKDSNAALESFNPVGKAQKAGSNFSAMVRTRSDVLPSVSQRQLQRKRTLEVDVGFALARDEHKRKNRRIDPTGLARVLGDRSYEDDRVPLNPGEIFKNDDFQKHPQASSTENEVKLQRPRAPLDIDPRLFGPSLTASKAAATTSAPKPPKIPKSSELVHTDSEVEFDPDDAALTIEFPDAHPPRGQGRQQLLSGTYETGALGIFKETEPVLCIKYTISEDMTKREQARNKARLSAISDRPRILGSKRSSVLGFAHGRTGIEAHRNHATLLLKDRSSFSMSSRDDLQKKAQPLSPYNSTEWMALTVQELESRPGRKRVRPNTPPHGRSLRDVMV